MEQRKKSGTFAVEVELKEQLMHAIVTRTRRSDACKTSKNNSSKHGSTLCSCGYWSVMRY
eukprot:5348625-Amphidinium_carterae.1